MALYGFVGELQPVVNGSSPYQGYVRVNTTSPGFVMDGSSDVVFQDEEDHVAWGPNGSVDVSPNDNACTVQAKIIAVLVTNFNSQLSRSDGDTISWTFV